MGTNTKYTLLLIFTLLFCTPILAQYYYTGDSPASIKWRQISGENYKVIFPEEIDSLARRYLWLLENNRNNVMAGLNINPKKFPVIIHPHTAYSNGLVTWVPKRMELYSQPTNDTDSQNWEKQLVIHESRHVGQISHFTKGIYKIIGILGGEQIYGLGVGVYASRQFLEGDAVATETELSNSGRGREPSFLEYYRAALLEGDYRTRDQWRFGSYKYYAPDQYAYGYIRQSAIKYKYSMYDYPGKYLDYHVKKFYNPLVSSAANKKFLGEIEENHLIHFSLNVMDSIWQEDLSRRGNISESTLLSHSMESYYNSYSNPIALSKDSVLYINKSHNNPTSLVLVSSNPKFLKENRNKEKILRFFASGADGFELSKDKKRLYFTEIIRDIRWHLKSYNKLFYYDLESGKIVKVSDRGSYNSPSLSPDDQRVAVVEYPITGGSAIFILDSYSGEKLGEINAPYQGQLTECAWIGDYIYSFAITGKGLGLFRANITNGLNNPNIAWETLINEQNASFHTISSVGNDIYFSSGVDGVNNIYKYNVYTTEFTRLTNSLTGAHEPSAIEGRIFFSQVDLGGNRPVFAKDQSVEGLRVSLEEKILTTEYENVITKNNSKLAEDFLGTENFKASFDTERVPETPSQYKDIKSERFNRLTNLINIHSWAPVYFDADEIVNDGIDDILSAVKLGAVVMSQNLLGTATTSLGYSYSNGYHAGHLKFKYTGLYPVIEADVDINRSQRFGYKYLNSLDNNGSWGNYLTAMPYDSPLVESYVRSYIPLTFNSHGWLRGFTPYIEWQFNNNTFHNHIANKSTFTNQLGGTLQYYQQLPTAKGAIYPKWGTGLTLRGSWRLNSGENFGSVATAYWYGYAPGLFERQGIKLFAGYQKQFIDNKFYYTSNLLSGPRGLSSPIYDESMLKLSLDYAAPIYLGDINLGGIAYLQRLQFIPYVDYVKTSVGQVSTIGADLILDAHFIRLWPQFNIGIRYGHNSGDYSNLYKKNTVQLLLNIAIE